MNRRQVLKTVLATTVGTSLARSSRVLAQDTDPNVHPVEAGAIYLHPATGADSNSGAKDSLLRTLAAAARRINESTSTTARTIILS